MAAAESMASGAQARQRVNAAFPHGVASGDPTADAVVCVTRANPPSCGVTIQLRWPVALDPACDRPVASGKTVALPEPD